MENNHNKSYSFIDSNLSKDSQIYDLDPIFPKWYKTVRKESKDIWTDIPLQTACEVLFEKWIITNWSRANNESTEVYYIAIDIDSLSDNNKQILYQIQNENFRLYEKYGNPWDHKTKIWDEECIIQPWIIMEAYIPDRRRDEKGNVERKHGNTITDVEAYFFSKVDLFEDQHEKKNWIIRIIKRYLNKIL